MIFKFSWYWWAEFKNVHSLLCPLLHKCLLGQAGSTFFDIQDIQSLRGVRVSNITQANLAGRYKLHIMFWCAWTWTCKAGMKAVNNVFKTGYKPVTLIIWTAFSHHPCIYICLSLPLYCLCSYLNKQLFTCLVT